MEDAACMMHACVEVEDDRPSFKQPLPHLSLCLSGAVCGCHHSEYFGISYQIFAANL